MGSSPESRLSWTEICSQKRFQGRWLALDGCRYDGCPDHPAEAVVVDNDDDLAELCARMKRVARGCCTILYCDAPRRQRTISQH